MTRPFRKLTLALAFCLAPAATSLAADLVLVNGAIYTQDPSRPWVEAMVVEQGEITFTGAADDARSLATPASRVIDLKGRFVMPGIHDVHMHPLEAGNPAAGTCLLEIGRDPESYHGHFHDCAPEQLGTDWVLGWGHYIHDILESGRPPVDILDEALPDRKALMMEFTSHSHWANSAALEALGINADSADPAGGIIMKDPQTGQPNGILIDNAGIIAESVSQPDTPELRQLMYEGLLDNLSELARHGITSVVDARSYWKRGHHEIWQRAEAEGELTARVNLALWAYPEIGDGQMEEIKALYSNDPERLLRINQVKVYSDGIVGNTTARMKEPYQIDLGLGIEGNRGLNYFTEDRLTRFMVELEKTGFDFLIHTIGDDGIHEALNAIEAVRRTNGTTRDRRHRLTHVEIVDPADIPRFRQLEAIADFQVAGDWTFPEEYAAEGAFVGNRANNPFPINTVFNTGAMITLSSDFDVSTMNPFVGMEHALVREPERLPDVATVIAAYTVNGAHTMRQGDLVGRLKPGMLADFIVLDRNLFEIRADQIGETKVLATFLEGEEVHRAGEF